MAELLQNWLNNEIELSHPVKDFAKDFANGYLFGELLYKFNQQSNFKEFSKKENVASKIDNFNKLQPTLKNLKVKFDSKMIDAIMKEERGVALRLLYQLKMALEKVYPPTDISVLRKTGKMGDNQPALKIAHSKEKYDQHAQVFFEQRLQVLNKPQKQLNMEKHLSKFDEEKMRQEKVASEQQKDEDNAKDKMRQEIRRAQINKLQRNAGFMEEWLQKGIEDWKKNQSIKKDRERRSLEFEYKQTEKYHQFAVTKIEDSTKEVVDGIDQFERTLKNIGINPKVDKEFATKAVNDNLQNSPMRQSQRGPRYTQSLASTKQNATTAFPLGKIINITTNNMTLPSGAMTLTSTGLKTKDKKTVTEQTRKERERRRRKMIVDQAKTHIEMEQKRREVQIVERMNRQSKQEEELQYEQWRTNQCRNVITENRKLREARYEKRKELDQQTANWREEEMLKSLKEQMDREMKTFKERDQEMRIISKQAHRERRNEFGQVLFDAIFDIANEAYIHQQKSDTGDIDSRNWHEWLQLFIDQMPIEGTLSKLTELKTDAEAVEMEEQLPADEANVGEDGEVQEAEFVDPGDATNPQQKLDMMELCDYLKNQGQWTTDIITENQPNLEQFLTGQTEQQPAPGAKGGKGAPAKAAVEQIQLEEGDTELPLQAPNNFILGDAVEQIIHMNFEGRQRHMRPKMPQHLALKLCFVGYCFAGKKTQALRLKEQLGIDTYQLNELVTEAVLFYESNQEPIRSPLADQQADDFEEEISEDSEREEAYCAEEDFRACGEKISGYLKEGQEIPDEVYVELFVAKLRLTYTHKSKRILRHELRVRVEKERKIMKEIEAVERELNEELGPAPDEEGRKKRKKQAISPEQRKAHLDQLREELAKLKEIERNGWVLIDFPSTFSQAKLLEQALSGYVPKQECNPIDREQQIEDAFLLVQPTAKEEVPKCLTKSGLDAVIWFDLSRDECMRRALGRRYDHVNDKMYHIEDAPPLTTNAPQCERLVPMDEEDNAEATLIDRWISFDNCRKSLENWLRQFGDSETEQSILYQINGEGKADLVYSQIMKIIDSVIERKQAKTDMLRERIHEKISKAEQEEEERIQRELQEEEERRKKEEEGAIEGQEQQQPKKDESKVAKPEPATERVPPKEPAIQNIDEDFKPSLIKVWQELSVNYQHQMKKVLKQVRVQRERIVENFSHISNEYLKFLHRPDVKQEKLEQFIRDFNEFSDQFPDLREDDQTKEELHQRVDILSDELWEIIEERKEQHIEERKKIMESGWVEYEQTFMVTCAQQLMQAEVDKFKASVQILHDYYHAFEDKLIPEAPPQLSTELVAEGEDLPPVEALPEGADSNNPALYTYPRLDKLFEKGLKAQVVPDVTQLQSQAQDKKGGPPAKGKDPKKPAEEEKQVEESVYVKEMKAAIKIEKSILRFRLTQIRNWTLKRLKEMRAKACKMYTKLEDWILVSNKAENDAVEEMCVVVKRAIEEEQKIQDELRIKFMDFCVDEKIMNFIIPPPELLPALEEVRKDRFSIAQLRTLADELELLARQYGNGSFNVPNKIIIDLFVRKLETSKTLGDEGSLPEEWKKLTEYDLNNIIRNLDKYNTGAINWKLLATFIILLKTPIPTDKNIESYRHEYELLYGKEEKISMEQFGQVPAWFDESEWSTDRDYSHPFERVQYIKELLFRVFADRKHNKICFDKFTKSIKAKEFTMFRRNIKHYGDVLLLPANDK